jgi:hypothetical protein
MTASAFWTPERHERMLELLKDGLSTAAIARELGTTKNAVIGRLDRKGIKQRVPEPPTLAERLPPPPPDRGGCRWIHDNTRYEWWSYCGEPVARGSYCAVHAKRVYQPA